MRRVFLSLAIASAVSGCVGVATEGARGTVAKITVENNMEMARKGDREAQYKVGNALCCSVDNRGGLYDTRQSVAWLCASAAQAYGPAMFKLGRIYAGDTIDGVRVIRRAAAGIAGTPQNLPVSYAWFANAKAHGVPEASEKTQEIWTEMTPAQQRTATQLVERGLKVACSWDEAMPGRR